MQDFDSIKRLLGKFGRSSIFHYALENLRVIQQDNSRPYPVWNLLTLIKWAYLYSQDGPLRRPISLKEFNELVKSVHEFEVSYEELNFKSKKGVDQSFRIIAFQQFFYQVDYYPSLIYRQLALYTGIKTKHDIEHIFYDCTGIELTSFCQQCSLTYFYLFQDILDDRLQFDDKFNQDYFDLFRQIFPRSDPIRFLNLLTIKSPEQLEGLQKLDLPILQLYETNFFVTRPFLLFRNEYRIPCRQVFIQTIKNFIYTFLKSKLPDLFPEDFGRRMEQYVEWGIKEIGVKYSNDKTLRNSYSLNKVVDYLLDDNILIECKATELHPRAGVLRQPEVMAKSLDSTIVKAYQQLLSTAAKIDSNRTWYGIIITYQEMYLGFGPDAWEEFLEKPITTYCSQTDIPISVLPPENLFFLTLENWDYIVQVIKNGIADLHEILRQGQKSNRSQNISEKMMLMDQVLYKFFKLKTLDLTYLNPYKNFTEFK